MQIYTKMLNKIAFYTTFGAKITKIEGKYPNNEFYAEAPAWLVWYERAGGWVPYNKFCNQRIAIKRKCRRMANLPDHFVGDGNSGWKLGDLAVFQPWNKKGK